MYYTYKMIHLPTGRVYIGQRKLPKGKNPESDRYYGSGKIWKRIYSKHKDECIKVILGIYDTKEAVNQAEVELVAHYKSVWGKFCVNVTDGGEGWSHKHSLESRKKMSETRRNWTPEQRALVSAKLSASSPNRGKPAYNRGVRPSEEAIEKNRLAHIGKKASDETKRKIGEASKGRKHTEESKQKIREAAKGRKISTEQRKKLSNALKGRKLTEEVRRKISDANKGRVIKAETREKIRKTLIGHSVTDETREKMKIKLKERYADPAYREKFKAAQQKRREREKMRKGVA